MASLLKFVTQSSGNVFDCDDEDSGHFTPEPLGGTRFFNEDLLRR